MPSRLMSCCIDCGRVVDDSLDVVPTGEAGGKLSLSLPVDLGLKEAKLKQNVKQEDVVEVHKEDLGATHELLRLPSEEDGGAMSAVQLATLVRSATTRAQSKEVEVYEDETRMSCTRCCLEESDSERWDRAIWSWFLRFLCFLVLCALSFISTIVVLGNQVGDSLTIEVRTEWVGTPENLVDALRGQCIELRQQAAPLIHQIEEYNRQNGYRELSFVTPGEKQAEALFLPSGATRVVVVHGRAQHGLASSAQAAGYFLRQMGISAFIIMDLSKQRGNTSDWMADVDTVVGAIDYVLGDPDGFLGGPVAASQVGVVGFDFGGFSSQQALTQRSVGALLLDGVVSDWQVLVDAKVKEQFPLKLLQPLFTAQVRSRCEMNLQHRLEEVTMAVNGTVGVIHGGEELIPAQARQAAVLEAGADLRLNWSPEAAGAESCKTALHLSHTQQYQARFCNFFASALSLAVNCT